METTKMSQFTEALAELCSAYDVTPAELDSAVAAAKIGYDPDAGVAAYLEGDAVYVPVFGRLQAGTVKARLADARYTVADLNGVTATFNEEEISAADYGTPAEVWTE